jgi:hypothetical protein
MLSKYLASFGGVFLTRNDLSQGPSSELTRARCYLAVGALASNGPVIQSQLLPTVRIAD